MGKAPRIVFCKYHNQEGSSGLMGRTEELMENKYKGRKIRISFSSPLLIDHLLDVLLCICSNIFGVATVLKPKCSCEEFMTLAIRADILKLAQ